VDLILQSLDLGVFHLELLFDLLGIDGRHGQPVLQSTSAVVDSSFCWSRSA
jgi:hypothetical protein